MTSAAPERTLSHRELNRALLARQLLLDRRKSPIPKALERVAGIQAQYAPSMYVGLWSRLDEFERGTLTRALERRSVVQGTLLRQTIHLVSRRDWWIGAIAVRDARRKSWLRHHDATAAQMAAAARKARKRLGEGPVPRKELVDLIGMGAQGITGINLWLDLVRVPPSGTWERRRADLFGLAEDWLGRPPRLNRGVATIELVKSYLRGFGPATPNEVADWAGLGLKEVGRALETLKLRRFTAEDGAELVDLPRMPLPDPDSPAPVRFLPTWDATLLVHARRSQILAEGDRPKVFNVKTPQSVPTFTVDGQVAGTWKFVRGSIRIEPFRKLDRAVGREIDAEADRLAEFHA
jgi:Winged helix DNA-binding domain